MPTSRPWTGRCHRCGHETDTHIMSRFNIDLICTPCEEEERRHPDYNRARRAEEEAVRNGERNYPGVGWPGLGGRVR